MEGSLSGADVCPGGHCPRNCNCLEITVHGSLAAGVSDPRGGGVSVEGGLSPEGSLLQTYTGQNDTPV